MHNTTKKAIVLVKALVNKAKLVYSGKKLLLTACLIAIFISYAPVAAWDTASDIAECERRNVVFGCACDCRNTQTMCRRESSNTVGGTPIPLEGCLPGRPGESLTTETLQLQIFPVAGGIFILDANGNLDVIATATNIARWVFWILAFLAILFGFYGAFRYSTAGDDEDKVKEGAAAIRNALVGFIISIVAIILVSVISSFVGFDAGSADPSRLNNESVDPGGVEDVNIDENADEFFRNTN